MSFDVANPFEILELKQEPNLPVNAIPQYGFTCQSCGYDSTYTYNGHEAILSHDLGTLVVAWTRHLVTSHGLTRPPRKCTYEVKMRYVIDGTSTDDIKRYPCTLYYNHDGLHQIEHHE